MRRRRIFDAGHYQATLAVAQRFSSYNAFISDDAFISDEAFTSGDAFILGVAFTFDDAKTPSTSLNALHILLH